MKYVSTGNKNIHTINFIDTLLNPIPENGELWIPNTFPVIKQWPSKTAPLYEFVNLVVNRITGYSFDFKESLEDIPIDITKHNDDYILNLHRGPTLSFKDFGCLCAAHIYKHLGIKRRTIVATSGDTGAAAAHAFGKHKLPITIVFPKNKISPFQANQMIQEKNADVYAINGDFDECQKIIKKYISKNNLLTCNSISLARLLPQIGYYAYLAVNVPNVNVIVPSGNLGNATSAYMAKLMGCKINNIILACNDNDAAVRFFNDVDKLYIPKKTIQTLSSAMDIGDPSNIVRLWNLMNHDKKNIKAFSIKKNIKNNNEREHNYCPHTSIGLKVSSILKNMTNKCIIRTADNIKFSKKNNIKMPYVQEFNEITDVFANNN
jgi:threonine synthase